MLTDSWNALNHHLALSYDARLFPISAIDGNGETTTTSYNYDSSGNTTVTYTLPGEASGSYTSQSSTKTACTLNSTLPCFEILRHTSLYPSAISRIFYDSHGREVETLTPGPGANQVTVTFTVYNDQTHSVFKSVPFVVANRTTWLDPNGATDITGKVPGGTIITRDALGRTLTVTDPLGNQTRILYNVENINGDNNTYVKVTTIDANQHVTASYSDALGRTRYTFSYSGISGGTLTATTRTNTQYNALNQAISFSVTDLVPQPGQIITEVTTTVQYDDQGKMIAVTDPDRGNTLYTYNLNGQVIKEVNGSRVLGTSYDLLGRPGCLQEGENTAALPGTCDGGNLLVQYTYDKNADGGSDNAIGRLTQTVTTTYLANSNNTKGIVTEDMQYDVRGQLTVNRMQIQFDGGALNIPELPLYQMTQAYNRASQLTTTQTTVGGQPGYTFTNAYESTTGTLIGLSNTTTGAPTLAALSYNANALVSDILFKDTAGTPLATSHRLFDGNLRPASNTTSWQNGSAIFTDGVSYDALGNVMSRVSSQAPMSGVSGSGGNETQNFCYDELNQLVWASNSQTATPGVGQHCGDASLQSTLGGAYTSQYAYTHLGHLWRGPLGGSGAQQQYLYCNSAKPHQVTHLSPLADNPTCSNPGTTQYNASYDAWGNVTTRTFNSEIGMLSYNGLDQMTHWSKFGGTKQEWYLYDAGGERVARYSVEGTNNSLTIYAFGLQEHQYQIDGTGNITPTNNTYYYFLDGNTLGMLNGVSSLSTTFLLTDTLGSLVTSFSTTPGTAQVLGQSLYDPYGNQRYKQGTTGTDKGFTGQYKDNLTGLQYYGARYYDPVVGLFLSADTIEGNMQGMNPYAYVGGNPTTYTDPSGNLAMMPHPGGGGSSRPVVDARPPSSTSIYTTEDQEGYRDKSIKTPSGGRGNNLQRDLVQSEDDIVLAYYKWIGVKDPDEPDEEIDLDLGHKE